MISTLLSLGYLAPLPKLISFRCRYLPGIWNSIYGFLSHCLTPQAIVVDKANRNFMELYLGFCFYRHIDYTWLIWNEIKEAIAQKSTRRPKSYIPYHRYFQLLISHVMLQNPLITERSTRDPIRPTTIKFLAATLVGENDSPMATPLDLLNFADEDHPTVFAYRTEHYPRQAMGPQAPVDPYPALEPERREEGERDRQNINESLGGVRVGCGEPPLEE